MAVVTASPLKVGVVCTVVCSDPECWYDSFVIGCVYSGPPGNFRPPLANRFPSPLFDIRWAQGPQLGLATQPLLRDGSSIPRLTVRSAGLGWQQGSPKPQCG